MNADPGEYELDIFIPTFRESKNLKGLLPWVKSIVRELKINARIAVVDATGDEETRILCKRYGVLFLTQERTGFGEAIRLILSQASAPWLLTMDADHSHPPDIIRDLWAARQGMDLVIASRYVSGGGAETSWLRKFLSRCLNKISRFVLQTQIRDLTTNFRLYRTQSIKRVTPHRQKFDVLQEVLVHLLNLGAKVIEVPFFYEPRFSGTSHVRLWSFGMDYLKAVVRDWRIRNSLEAYDYDSRAFDSVVPLQRYWQRKRHSIISDMAQGQSKVVDIGCGSSRLILDHKQWIGIDLNPGKLHFVSTKNPHTCCASVSEIPIKSETVDCVICSQVIEHIQDMDLFWKEFRRILKPGGTLILGTPDYGLPFWPCFEFLHSKALPQGYMVEHCTHWTLKTLLDRLALEGFVLLEYRYILKSELIVKAVRTPAR